LVVPVIVSCGIAVISANTLIKIEHLPLNATLTLHFLAIKIIGARITSTGALNACLYRWIQERALLTGQARVGCPVVVGRPTAVQFAVLH
jgi:uncharacterized membrane protein